MGENVHVGYLKIKRNYLLDMPTTTPIVVIRNSVLNGKTQLEEGDKQTWPISFY